MKYLKTLLVDGAEIARLNKLIADGPNDQPDGQVLGTFTEKFSNDYYMTIEVINLAAGPAITATLYDHRDGRVGREEMIPGGLDQDFPCEFMDDNYRLTIERAASTRLTDEAAKHYVATGGVRCPHCQSDDVDASPIQADGGVAWGKVECMACGARWRDQFTLSGVESVEGPSQNVGRPPDPES